LTGQRRARRKAGNGVHEAGRVPNFMDRFMQTNKAWSASLVDVLINLNRR
jgi:hypothetical protein